MSLNFVSHRYKLLDPVLWPSYIKRMSHREATKHLIDHYHLQKMVKYGKTRLFVRTSMTMYFLENLRSNRLPPMVCLSVCLSICLSVCLSVNLSVCLSQYSVSELTFQSLHFSTGCYSAEMHKGLLLESHCKKDACSTEGHLLASVSHNYA